MVEVTVTSGRLSGSDGNDVLTGVAQRGTGQIHAYAEAGNDSINLSFSNIDRFSHGHHARGDADGSMNRGSDTFNFINLHEVDDVVVGRLEDFDPSRDTLSINGSAISLSQLGVGSGTTGGYTWRVVEYDADSRDSATQLQQWLLIDTGSGYVFYALEGARATNGNGASDGGQQEAHFIGASNGHRVTSAELDSLTTVGYIDPQNFVPAGLSPQGGVIINDDDNGYSDTLAQIDGTSFGDLIAAGLNDDNVRAGAGNDRVWGGSGNDTINGDDGNDTIFGGAGDDRLIGGRGDDHVLGDHGDDVLHGWAGNDNLHGGDGDDRLYGQTGNDTLSGGNGNDRLFGAEGNDVLYGGNGNDRISGGAGLDVATGGGGADVFEFRTGDLVDWDNISGNVDQKNAQLDLITDFAIGTDRLDFTNFSGVSSMSDLRAWKTVIDGDVHFTVQVRATNERVLVNVEDSVQWGELFVSDNFIF